MKPLFTEQEFKSAKSSDKLLCECVFCNSPFSLSKSRIQRALNPKQFSQGKYCSRECYFKSQIVKQTVTCKNCFTEFDKDLREILRYPNHFCSKSCAATHNNKNKSHGNRRSKVEKFIEFKLSIMYPDMDIKYNKKDIINSELDIYIPSLNIAFELNGIYHYKPIHGEDKLNQIKENDNRKIVQCKNKNIKLFSIDLSSMNKFNEKQSMEFLNQIVAYIGIEPIFQD